MRISATIITFNEAEHIRDACASVAWADEIVVVDSESTDTTRKIATECGARVMVNPWPGFAAQKQFAVEAANHDWIFSLDADERVSAELQTSIKALQDSDESLLADGYRVPRRAFYLGRWIRGGGWYPDYQLRLFKRTRGNWSPRLIHESVTMKPGAKVETLNGDLLHYSMRDPEHHRQMIEDRYAPLGAQQMFADGKRTSRAAKLLAGPLTYLRVLVLRGGWRDGRAGLTIAKLAAHHALLKHEILYKIQNQHRNGPARN